MRATVVVVVLSLLATTVSGCASHYRNGPDRDGRARQPIVKKHPLAQKLGWAGVDATVQKTEDGAEEVVTTTGGAIVAGQFENVHYDWVILTRNGISGDRMAVDETECHIDVIVSGTQKTIRCHPSDACGDKHCSLDGEPVRPDGYKLFCGCK